MWSTYGQEEDTLGKTWDEFRQILLNAGMNRNNYLVEWSNSWIDYSLLKIVMEEHTLSHSILLIPLPESHPSRIIKDESIILSSFYLSRFQISRVCPPSGLR